MYLEPSKRTPTPPASIIKKQIPRALLIIQIFVMESYIWILEYSLKRTRQEFKILSFRIPLTPVFWPPNIQDWGHAVLSQAAHSERSNSRTSKEQRRVSLGSSSWNVFLGCSYNREVIGRGKGRFSLVTLVFYILKVQPHHNTFNTSFIHNTFSSHI